MEHNYDCECDQCVLSQDEIATPEWAKPIIEDRALESIRHQLNHHHDWTNGNCNCPPRGADEDLLQNRYHELTGYWWDTRTAKNTSTSPACCRVSGELYQPSESVWDVIGRYGAECGDPTRFVHEVVETESDEELMACIRVWFPHDENLIQTIYNHYTDC